MAAWDTLAQEMEALDHPERLPWLESQMNKALAAVAAARSRNVIFYGSAFLQKPWAPGDTVMLTSEDMNGLMTVVHGMDATKGLTLILHTPGGVTNAAESIVHYLRAKFGKDVEVIIPLMAMSAGTMISLAASAIVMGRQSQLGPIDPQMPIANGGHAPASAIVQQFERAQRDISASPLNAHLWAPILASLGPSLLQTCSDAIDRSETMVAEWLKTGLFCGEENAEERAAAVAGHFNDAATHKDHGRRIGRDEAIAQGLRVESLEDDQGLQECVLTAYHLATIAFEQTALGKFIWNDAGRHWFKNIAVSAES